MYSSSEIQFNRVCYLFKKSKNILICGHLRPDADSVGSSLALYLALIPSKKVFCFNPDPTPENFRFLPEIEVFKTKIDEIKADLIVVLDSGSLKRSALSGINLSLPIINIDHHHDNQNFGLINIIRPVSSTAEILSDLFLKMKIKITPKIATCLLSGIFDDTDGFRNPNVTPQTLKITSSLLSAGASMKKIVQFLLYKKSITALKLWGKVLSRLCENKYGMICTVVSKKDFADAGASKKDLEGLANYISCLPNKKAILLLSEEEGKIHGSLRTQRDDIDVSRLAALFGAGGHQKAAGFTIPGKLIKTENGWKVI